jgi:hypothetical protein
MMARLRASFCLLVAMLLAACGARDHLGVASNGPAGSSGGAPTNGSTSSSTSGGSGTGGSVGLQHHLAHVRADCAPTDAPGLGFHIDDTTSCTANANPGIYVFVVGDAPQPGVPLSISSDPNGAVQAQRIGPGGGATATGTGGTITFTTFVKGTSAAGSYDITFADSTTEQGDFTASFCPGIATCG